MTEKLELCPFCSSEVTSEIKLIKISEVPCFTIRVLFFKCQNPECGAIVSFDNAKTNTGNSDAIDAAIEQWNGRASNA